MPSHLSHNTYFKKCLFYLFRNWASFCLLNRLINRVLRDCFSLPQLWLALFSQLWILFINLFMSVFYIFSSFLLLFSLICAISLCKFLSSSGTMKLLLLPTLFRVDSVLTSSQDIFGMVLSFFLCAQLCDMLWQNCPLRGLLDRACWPCRWSCLRMECVTYIKLLLAWDSFPSILFYALEESEFQEELYLNG